MFVIVPPQMNAIVSTTVLVICLLPAFSLADSGEITPRPLSAVKRLGLATHVSAKNPNFLRYFGTNDELEAIWNKAIQGAQIMDGLESNKIPNCALLPMGCRIGDRSPLWRNKNLKKNLLSWNSFLN
ncbi:unnamed protein product [Cylicocyclus nassatus]|uniref:Uncharacterized protein n=1 Tax=Cylicocyclus nassatus TaxID=53992 RepID=A0AA36H4M4_CYLNA|nr:unnamed protein product [Cylicocyclus nassatus]